MNLVLPPFIPDGVVISLDMIPQQSIISGFLDNPIDIDMFILEIEITSSSDKPKSGISQSPYVKLNN